MLLLTRNQKPECEDDEKDVDTPIDPPDFVTWLVYELIEFLFGDLDTVDNE
jgi:hypothetical protein